MSATDDSTRKLNFIILSQIVKQSGLTSYIGFHIITSMIEQINNSDKTENGLLLLQVLIKSSGRGIEPYTIPLVPRILALHVDKSANVRDLSAVCGKELFEILCPQSFRLVYPMLVAGMEHENWKIKVGALNLLKTIAPRMSSQLSPLLPELIPKVSDCVSDSKKQVQTAALEALNVACLAISNEDIRPLVPQLVSVIARPEESITTLNMLLETTFVATVDAPVLALIAPLLGKSLKNRSSVMKRKASKVIDIMCRLVQNPSDVAPFKEMLLPALDKVIDELVDAEVCDVAKAAREILLQALGEGRAQQVDRAVSFDLTEVRQQLLTALRAVLPAELVAVASAQENSMCEYVSQLCAYLVLHEANSDPSNSSTTQTSVGVVVDTWQEKVALTLHAQWKDCVVPYIKALLHSHAWADAHALPSSASKSSDSGSDSDGAVLEEKSGGGIAQAAEKLSGLTLEESAKQAERVALAEKIAMLFRVAALNGVPDKQIAADDDGSNLCNIEFSLAFGGKILLHNTFLKLGRGRRYGVMGKNGAGKTTLLTNIGSGNIEGMPASLKTVYVQHDDASEDNGVSLIDELMTSKDLIEASVTPQEASEKLCGIGFTIEMLEAPRSSLSGGWKMKLLIIKAMLSKADVLLLDEPTNHLDTASVAWLTNYIISQHNVTCLIVSHDTGFLDNVLTDVIHYEGKKLVYYHGNLTHFVSIHPEAKYYYELEGSTLAFKFPVPGRLDGINSNTRSILKMENVSFTYPGASKVSLTDINVKVCLGSRVAVVGANGAGKSTLIKLLVQETAPDEGCGGTIWKHMNLRIAYVAQHSFHHVEMHLDSSPVDYMKWRFYGGVDREDMARPDKKLTEEEEVVLMGGERKYGDVEGVHGRRKNGRTMEYECSFVGQIQGREPNKYIPLEKMVELGLLKLVQQCDTRTAAMAAGLDIRPLLTQEIQNHLNDFNLEAEFGTHGTIKRLSGGQKVKLVLAAAMWNQPHLIVLDEPTNYLDREALGALTQAIKSFHGGIVIISHNKEFTDAICTENWLVQDGQCFTQGGVEEANVKAKSASSVKKSRSAPNLSAEDGAAVAAGGNTNKSIVAEIVLNPRTLEALSKKQVRLMERCAAVAGMSMKDYVLKINCKSPEWKWL